MDPVELQVITGALRAICEEMGAVLIRSAHSANIKERRDASTALFDARGEMLMQAEHIPVHLGAMPAAVAAIRAAAGMANLNLLLAVLHKRLDAPADWRALQVAGAPQAVISRRLQLAGREPAPNLAQEVAG